MKGLRKGALLALPLALIAVAVVLPMFAALLASLTVGQGLGLTHYLNFLQRPQYAVALANTAWLAVAATSLSLLLVLPACIHIGRRGRLAVNLFTGLLVVCLAISGLMRTLAWQIILSRQGPLNTLLLWAGWIDQPLDLLYSRGAVIVGMAHVMLPLAAAVLLNSMRHIDHSLIFAARTLGASRWRSLRDLWWPQMRRPLCHAFLLVFAMNTGFFLLPALLGGPGDTVLGKVMLGDIAFDFDNGPNMAATSGMFMTLMVLAMSGICLLAGGTSFTRGRRQ